MSFKVSCISGPPSFDSLPVAVIKNYPLERRDYKSYAQAILCVNEESLFLRMWAFEVSPPPGSELRCVLYLYPGEPETAFCLSAYADETVGCFLIRNGIEVPAPGRRPQDVILHPYSGEDLQGVYWGSTITVSRHFLQELGGEASLAPGSRFGGNFFKLCTLPPFVHKGSFFPADFTANPYLPASMGDLSVVSY